MVGGIEQDRKLVLVLGVNRWSFDVRPGSLRLEPEEPALLLRREVTLDWEDPTRTVRWRREVHPRELDPEGGLLLEGLPAGRHELRIADETSGRLQALGYAGDDGERGEDVERTVEVVPDAVVLVDLPGDGDR